MVDEIQRNAFVGVFSGYMVTIVTGGYGIVDMVSIALLFTFLPYFFYSARYVSKWGGCKIENWLRDSNDERIEYDWSTNRAS